MLCTALLFAGGLAPVAPAQDAFTQMLEAMRAQIEQLNREVATLRAKTETLENQLDQARYGAPAGEDEFYIPRLAADFEAGGEATSLGNMYTKPFLTNLGERTYLGGYFDIEYVDSDGSDDNRYFDQHRFVPLIYADVSDRVKIAAEIEIEHGSELEVEFAQLDYLINDAFNVRTGIQLLPLGKLNEVHDSPIQDLTMRPLVNKYIIPTTLRDAGVGFWGNISESVSYHATISNGFRGLDAMGNNVITPTSGLRNAAPQKDGKLPGVGPFDQINDNLAYTGRVAFKPELGVEVGVSALFDKYDEKGENGLFIYALDATIDGKAVDCLPDNLELLGEAAFAEISRDTFAEASGVAGDMYGYYVQGNWHFDPTFLDRFRESGAIEEEAHFTFVTRLDHIMLDTYEHNRTTFGLNFRPNAHDTVFKLDFQMNSDSGSAKGKNDDNAIVLSAASYF
ncbi:MAG: hypothetical protein ACYTCU_03450 [Planctomycetota bacterium]|jgi:outer membrane murein-binding lipoprotein Lpp